MPLILKKDQPITGDLLRSLSKHDLKLARLEMTWERRDRIKVWTQAAIDVARFWRGARIRHLAAVRRDARNKRRGAVGHMRKAHEVLIRRDPAELESALPWLNDANEEDPKCGEVWSLRGEILYALERFGESRQSFSRSLMLLPDEKNPGALLGRARGAAMMKDWAQAEEDLSLLLEREPPPQSKALQMAERRYNEALIVHNNNKEKEEDGKGKTKQKRRTVRGEHGEKLSHVQKAAVAIYEGRMEHAVVEADATFAHAHYLRGCVRVEMQDWVGAEFDFEKWLKTSAPRGGQRVMFSHLSRGS